MAKGLFVSIEEHTHQTLVRLSNRECPKRWAKIGLCRTVQIAKRQLVKIKPVKPMQVHKDIGVCTVSESTRLIQNIMGILKACENGQPKCMWMAATYDGLHVI